MNTLTRKLAAVAAVGVAVAVAVSLAVLSAGTSAPHSDQLASTITQDVVNAVENSGANCLGALCIAALPERIALSDVAAYLAQLRGGLSANNTPEDVNTCHSLAHEIGRRGAEALTSVPTLLALDDGGCLYGYQHGVLEGWAVVATDTEFRSGLAGACSAYTSPSGAAAISDGQRTYAQGSCAHGLGHAISLQNSGTLLDAVSYCDALEAGLRSGCAGGVLMAYSSESASQGEYAPKRALELSVSDVQQICNTVGTSYTSECWAKLWLLAERVGLGPDETAALCPSGEYREPCGHGVGVSLMYTNGLDPSVAAPNCPAGLDPYCGYGIAWANANTWAGAGNTAAGYQSICAQVSPGSLDGCVRNEQDALQGAAR
jgi:hypothetical protein